MSPFYQSFVAAAISSFSLHAYQLLAHDNASKTHLSCLNSSPIASVSLTSSLAAAGAARRPVCHSLRIAASYCSRLTNVTSFKDCGEWQGEGYLNAAADWLSRLVIEGGKDESKETCLFGTINSWPIVF